MQPPCFPAMELQDPCFHGADFAKLFFASWFTDSTNLLWNLQTGVFSLVSYGVPVHLQNRWQPWAQFTWQVGYVLPVGGTTLAMCSLGATCQCCLQVPATQKSSCPVLEFFTKAFNSAFHTGISCRRPGWQVMYNTQQSKNSEHLKINLSRAPASKGTFPVICAGQYISVIKTT